MMRRLLPLATACCLLSMPGFAAEAHQDHRRPADLKEYLAHLDSEERDQHQKPGQVIEALALKPGMAVADLGSGSGYFTRRFIEAVTDTGKVYAVDVEPEMLRYTEESIVHMHRAYTLSSFWRELTVRNFPMNQSICSSSATPITTWMNARNTSPTPSRR